MTEDAARRPIASGSESLASSGPGEAAGPGSGEAAARVPVADEAAPATLGRRNDRLLLVAVAAYALILSILMIAKGVSVTPDVLLVAFGMAAVLLGRGRLFLRDWIPFIALFLAYELMRGYADKFGAAIHVTDVVDLERIVGLGGLPTVWLQGLLHHGAQSNPDPLAMVSVIFYFLHFPLPLAVGFLLWIHRRASYYDFVAALILLSIAGFVTFLVLPVGPPWWADQHGYVSGVLHLRDNGFAQLAQTFGFGSNYFYSYTSLYSISSNDVAAFPSLHAGYPFLAFLFARRAFGRTGWLMLLYTFCVWFAIVYLGEHWVVDIIGGVAYASAAYLVVLHGPAWLRRFMDRFEDQELEAGAEAEAEGDRGALRRLGRRVRWAVVGQGLAAVALGAIVAFAMDRGGFLGGTQTALYLVPWLAILGGLWRGAAGLLSR